MKTLSRESNTITIATFWENHLLGKYNYEPSYQRLSLWSDEKKSFLIDSILNNFPIPPIFLHQKIDDETGKTHYDVIDGKQRLQSIIAFIEGRIPSASESISVYSDDIEGVYFNQLDSESLSQYKRHFWKYSVPIEYVDTEDSQVIDDIFDRLNRNGEPLKGQELRNSQYYRTPLLSLISVLSKQSFWSERLKHLDASRMEDLEFTSELLFELLEGQPLAANQDILDGMYFKYAEIADVAEIEQRFDGVTKFMEALELDYNSFRIQGVSHLYGLWCLSDVSLQKGITPDSVKVKLATFFDELRSAKMDNPYVADYKKSMSSRTKSDTQRRLRLAALTNYLGI